MCSDLSTCIPTHNLRFVIRSVDASTPLRRLLADFGMTQEEFARANDMGVVTVNRWVNGKVNVNERKLAKAIAAVGANPADYGVDTPRAPQMAMPASDQPPAWAIAAEERALQRHKEVMEELGRLRRKLA